MWSPSIASGQNLGAQCIVGIFSDPQRTAIVASIPALTAMVALRGEVTDKLLASPSINFVKWLTNVSGKLPKGKLHKPLEKKVQNHRRAMIMSRPVLVTERVNLVTDAAARRVKKAEKKARIAAAATLAHAAAVVIPTPAVVSAPPAGPAAHAHKRKRSSKDGSASMTPPSSTAPMVPAVAPVAVPKPSASSKKARKPSAVTPAALATHVVSVSGRGRARVPKHLIDV